LNRKGENMKYQFICYTRCSTCQKAKKWLEKSNIEFEERPIKENNPKEDELKDWIERSGNPAKKFFNTSGNLYKDMKLKDKLPGMTDDEMIKLLSTDGMLVKRPILTGDSVVLVGFKEDEWKGKLLK
jgi:arsenate reductase